MAENTLNADTGQGNSQEFLDEDVFLKPKLDSIFAEVQASLPSIDFELSDMSSDEDVPIFHRALKTPTSDEEKDLDTSVNSQGYKDLLNNTSLDQLTGGRSVVSTSDNITEQITNDPSQIDSNILDALGSTSFSALDEIESIVKQNSRPKSAVNPFNTIKSSAINEHVIKMDIGGYGDKKRPKSAGASTASRPEISVNKIQSQPTPLQNTWMENDDNLTVCFDSPPESPTIVEKRKEIPELSPKRVENDGVNKEGATISKALKNKGVSKSRNTDVQKLENDSSKNVVSQYFTETPSLTLESVDLDNILIGIVTGAKVPPVLSGEESVESHEQSLIQKLAEMSMGEQANVNKDIDPNTGAYKSKSVGIKDIKTAKNNAVVATETKRKTSAMGTNTSDLANLPRASIPSPVPPQNIQDKRPTVYIDLRGFEKQKEESQSKFLAVQRILGITGDKVADSSDESDDDEEPIMWHEQRKKIKESLSRTGHVPSVVEKPKKKPLNSPRQPVGHTQAQRLAGYLPKPKDPTLETNDTKVTTSETVVTETKEQIVEKKTAEVIETEEKMKKLEEARKKRQKREADRQSRIRLGQRLEALRPSTSSTGRQPASEATPVLFDIEASYEPSPSTLPSLIMPHHELLLLTVNLSCNGEVTLHRSKTNHSVDTGMGLSASYTTVLTWLLSRVPNDFTFLQEPELSPSPSSLEAPFYVVGLQQLFLDGQLALYVAVTPIESFSKFSDKKAGKKSKQVKDEMKDSTPFQKAVQRYLTSNKLHTVCSWLSDLVSVEVTSRTSGSDTAQQPYVYKPDLPNITDKPLSTFVQINPDPNAVSKIFGLECGFFWETVETDELSSDSSIRDEGVEYETQNTMSLVYKQIYRDHSAIMGILNRVLQEGFDLAGVRLLYPTLDVMKTGPTTSSLPPVLLSQTENQSPLDMLNNLGPVLALAVRGAFARTLWLDAIGPSDPALARKTDPNSLCALYGGQSREECLLFCPRNPSRVLTELARWFGGRVPASGVIDVGHASKRGGKKSNKKGGLQNKDSEIPACKPPTTLTATSRSEVFLVVSQLIPTRCMGMLLATCQRRGYQLRGVKRCRLTTKKAQLLGIAFEKVPVFGLSTTTPASSVPGKESSDFTHSSAKTAPNPSTIFLMNKENAAHTVASLIEAFMVQMSFLNILGSLQRSLYKSTDRELSWSDFFHVTNYTDTILHGLGGDFSKTPEVDLATPSYIAPSLYSNPELEEIVVLTLTGHAFMKNFGLFLGKLQNVVPYNQISPMPSLQEGFELLGIKWLPGLSIQHAKELTPLEVGDKNWKASIQMLTSEPAVILVLRGINAFRRLEAVISHKTHIVASQKVPELDRIMSPTPELAYRQACLFFKEHELFADNEERPLLPYLPPLRADTKLDNSSQTKGKKSKAAKVADVTPGFVEEHILQTMQSGPRPLTTVLIVKPDVVQKHLGKLLRRVSQEGFHVVGMRLEVLNDEQAENIVPEEDKLDECLKKLHVDYLTGGCSLVLCLQRENAVKKLCDTLGPEDPKEAKRMSSFLWRAVFGSDPVANGLHGSADYSTSITEQRLFFPDGICCKENDDLIDEGIACPGEDPIINTQYDNDRKVVFTNKDKQEDSHSKLKTSGTSVRRVLTVSSLTQTNCIVFLPTLLQSEGRSKRFPFVEIMEHLLSHEFELVGTRMVWMTTVQAQHYLHLINAGSFNLVPCLTTGPCLILAVQRDNAVLALDGYLGSSYDKDSILSKYNYEMMRAKDIKQANSLLGFFFDKLSPESYAQIETS